MEFLAGEVPLTVLGLGILVVVDIELDLTGEFPSRGLLSGGDNVPRDTDALLPL